jgi:hypothetical protein
LSTISSTAPFAVSELQKLGRRPTAASNSLLSVQAIALYFTHQIPITKFAVLLAANCGKIRRFCHGRGFHGNSELWFVIADVVEQSHD